MARREARDAHDAQIPGVSLAIVFALAVGIPISLLPNHLIDAAMGESPPLDEGERVVGVVGFGQDGRAALHVADYAKSRIRLEVVAMQPGARRVLIASATERYGPTAADLPPVL